MKSVSSKLPATLSWKGNGKPYIFQTSPVTKGLFGKVESSEVFVKHASLHKKHRNLHLWSQRTSNIWVREKRELLLTKQGQKSISHKNCIEAQRAAVSVWAAGTSGAQNNGKSQWKESEIHQKVSLLWFDKALWGLDKIHKILPLYMSVMQLEIIEICSSIEIQLRVEPTSNGDVSTKKCRFSYRDTFFQTEEKFEHLPRCCWQMRMPQC